MRTLTLLLCVFIHCNAFAVDAKVVWPKGAKAAISLAYDDALNSQLDNAVPALDKYQLKASFYVHMGSATFQNRMMEWKALATKGHELGNHSLHHGCSKSKANRNWVAQWNDLDARSIEEMKQHIKIASSFLQALDNKKERTFTAPCADWTVSDGNYLNAIKNDFIAIKGTLSNELQAINEIDPYNVHIFAPESVSSEQLIEFVQKAAKMGTIANITFHGIGGDHMAVSQEAHREFLEYLAENRAVFWVDTFATIMKHLKAQSVTGLE